MKTIYLFIALLGFHLLGFSQQQKFEFERISTVDGLSQNNVLAIFKDSKGHIWFGTYDGLNMYNGYDFKVYRATDERNPLTSNFVQTITEDIYGNIWSGSFSNGVNRLNPETGEVLQLMNTDEKPNVLTSNVSNRVIADSKGRVWIATNMGLNLITQNAKGGVEITHYKNNPDDPMSLNHNIAFYIFEDSENRIWVSTETSLELMIMDANGDPQNKFMHFAANEGERDIREMVEVPEGYVYTTAEGATLLKFNKHAPEKSEYYLLENHASFHIALDLDGNLWTGGPNGVYFFEYKPNEEIPYIMSTHVVEGETEYNISNQFVRALHLDNAGILWLGTNGGGICKYNGRKTKFRHYKKTEMPGSIGSNKVWCFYEDKQNNLWVGTEGDGVNLLPAEERGNYNSGFTSIAVNPPGEQNYAFDIADISDDSVAHLWVGVGYNAKLVETLEQPNGKMQASVLFPEITHQVMALEVDEYKNVWMGTYEGGIYKFTPDGMEGKLLNYRPSNSSCPSTIIRNIKEDSKGRLWIGTDMGLMLLTREQKKENALSFSLFTHDESDSSSISNDYTVPILEDHTGTLWIGTFGGGLNRYREGSTLTNGTFSSLNINDGLASNSIYGLVEDNEGSIWITTNNGVSRLNKERDKIRNFDVHDGLQHMAFTDLSCSKMSDGEILLGGVKGFNAFYPHEIVEDTTPPNIVFSELLIMNHTVAANVPLNDRVIIEKNIDDLEEVILEFSENNFTIEFAALHYSLPNKNMYKYMLEGVDNDWIFASADSRFARYTNISAGTYTFKLMASNCYGVWAKEAKELTITINPPYYQTWWFRILMLVLVGAISYLLYRRKQNKVKRDKAVLQAKIDAGMAQLEESAKEIERTKAEVEENKRLMQQKEIEEKELRFFNTGLAKFGDIISRYDDEEELCHAILIELVAYVGAQAGMFYVIGDGEENEQLQVLGSYGAAQIPEVIMLGEGMVGTSFINGETIRLDNVPADYMKISSGLGELAPQSVSIIPVHQNESKVGVIEIASFNKMEDYKIDFIKKLGENITSTILLMRVIGKNQEIISEAQAQAEELRSQEEEMKQNIEELMATQDEFERFKLQVEQERKC